MNTKENKYKGLAAILRRDWNRRISLNRRMWMSEAVDSDEQMLASGERDLLLLLGEEITDTANKRVLEIGCGIGRMLIPAAKYFKSVVGVDVSEDALNAANLLIKSRGLSGSVETILVDGSDLLEIESNSVDLIYSYGTLGIVPTGIFACLLHEAGRILRLGRVMRFQLYLGTEQATIDQDTLAVRSYDLKKFTTACALCGFSIELVEELIHPIGNVSKPHEGIVAHIVSLKKESESTTKPANVELSLLDSPENSSIENWKGSALEYQMAITRAQKLVQCGNLAEAKALFQYAADNYADADKVIHKLLQEIDLAIADKS